MPGADALAESGASTARRRPRGRIAVPGAPSCSRGGDPVAIVTSASVPLATARLGAAGLRAAARARHRGARRAASPTPRATCSRPASSAPPPPTASCSKTRRPARGGAAAGMRVIGVLTTHARDELDAHELAPSIAAWLRVAQRRAARAARRRPVKALQRFAQIAPPEAEAKVVPV